MKDAEVDWGEIYLGILISPRISFMFITSWGCYVGLYIYNQVARGVSSCFSSFILGRSTYTCTEYVAGLDNIVLKHIVHAIFYILISEQLWLHYIAIHRSF